MREGEERLQEGNVTQTKTGRIQTGVTIGGATGRFWDGRKQQREWVSSQVLDER
jgi:hypothetical protein